MEEFEHWKPIEFEMRAIDKSDICHPSRSFDYIWKLIEDELADHANKRNLKDLERNAMRMHEIREPRHSSVHVAKSSLKTSKKKKKSSKKKKHGSKSRDKSGKKKDKKRKRSSSRVSVLALCRYVRPVQQI